MTRVLVCGGRYFADVALVFDTLTSLHINQGISAIIEGGATGADRHARDWAKHRGVTVETYRAAWNDILRPGAVVRYRKDGSAYDAAAGPWRNATMLRDGRPDMVVAFPGDTGTADMVRQARRAGLEPLEITARQA